MTVLTHEPPALSSDNGATAPPPEVGAQKVPGQFAPVAALHADGEVPAPWGPPGAPGACKEQYAAAAQHHVDPFGVLGLPSLWPAGSRSRVRPRPMAFGPAYNSSNFDIFLKSSYVVLVRRPHAMSVRAPSVPPRYCRGSCRLSHHKSQRVAHSRQHYLATIFCGHAVAEPVGAWRELSLAWRARRTAQASCRSRSSATPSRRGWPTSSTQTSGWPATCCTRWKFFLRCTPSLVTTAAHTVLLLPSTACRKAHSAPACACHAAPHI